DLARYKSLAAPRRFMVEKNAIAREQIVRLAIIDSNVEAISFRTSVGRARVKWRLLRLRHLDDLAEYLGRRCLVEFWFYSGFTSRFKKSDPSSSCATGRLRWHIEADSNVRLRAEIVNLVRLDIAQDRVERAGIIQVAVDEPQTSPLFVRVLIEVVYTICVK